MRLINVATFEMEEFFGDRIPEYEYAILSHTWGDDEVTFQDMKASPRDIEHKKGYTKIRYLVGQARRDNFKWAWADTCCIDKTSSAELSEAINSMYLWYTRSAVCYAYLYDVPEHRDHDEQGSPSAKAAGSRAGGPSRNSLRRIACAFIRGTGGEETLPWRDSVTRLLPLICEITSIPIELLSGKKNKNEYSVAQKMSWASKRKCTRQEDIAYCLMGIFDVNMPLLYGEEGGAFLRLQKEILQTTDDHSIYAWTVPKWSPGIWAADSVLAKSPADFADSADAVPTEEESGDVLSAITKQGLSISLPMAAYHFPINHALYWKDGSCETFRATLNCRIGKKQVEILLARDNSPKNKTHARWYYRIGTPSHLFKDDDDDGEKYGVGKTLVPIVPAAGIQAQKNIFIRLSIPLDVWARSRFLQSLRVHGIPFRLQAKSGNLNMSDESRSTFGDYAIVDLDTSTRQWSHNDNIIEWSGVATLGLFILKSSKGFPSVGLLCGINHDGLALCKLHALPGQKETPLAVDVDTLQHDFATEYFAPQNEQHWASFGPDYERSISHSLQVGGATVCRSQGEYEALGPTRKSYIVMVFVRPGLLETDPDLYKASPMSWSETLYIKKVQNT
ncbi:heterokaryon incompatibility protein-domain-containing protein [Podospora didyma]|uniref:Heterokaryon incompatibility protein-domain-containing protein n=1 Tax=Podospora didyma TaxID=330526 RepID=A0AAE0NUA9_9PEZI|nr:heterokaryon incompatibility protein-domain-containing protein [Podospora didyma]